MMTASEAVTDAQSTFNDMTSALGLTLLNKVHRNLCAEFKLYPTSYTQTLVAGTQLYALPGSNVSIRSVTYLRGPGQGDYAVLDPDDTDDFDRQDRNWRQYPLVEPRGFFVDGAYLGLYPAPNVGTNGISAGYPILSVQVYSFTPLGADDPLPDVIQNYELYVAGVCQMYARRYAKDQLALMTQLYQAEYEDTSAYMNRRNRHHVPQFTPLNMSGGQV